MADTIKIGNLDISSFKVGSDDCKVYLGDTLLYPQNDYSNKYLTFTITSSGRFKFNNAGINYSTDGGETWKTLSSTTAATPELSAGTTIMWKQTKTPTSAGGVGRFSASTTCRYTVEGNPYSVVYGDSFSNVTSLQDKPYALYGVFSGCSGMTSAENLALPATTLSNDCYRNMFYNCVNLTTAPKKLPATTLSNGCYRYMFSNCKGLTKAPDSVGITSTIMSSGSCIHMFSNCTSLLTAPELPSSTLAKECYYNMFYQCSGLTTPPSVLPATTLSENAYENMFYNCSGLTVAPIISAVTLSSNCCKQMFMGCSSLTTSPVLYAETMVAYCYENMFRGCSSLNRITCIATNPDGSAAYTSNWVNGVSSSGTFVKSSTASNWGYGVYGIPSGWSVENYVN